MRTTKRLPFYIAGGAAVSAAAIAGGIVAGTHSNAAKPAASTGVTTTTVQTRNTNLGQVLVDGKGRTLYLFAKDPNGQATCTGDCVQYWPPVLAKGALQAGSGASATDLGTVAAPDGGRQVSYAGHPLYYFIGDRHAGDSDGQALDQFGARWYALTPAGTADTNSASDAGSGGGGVGGY
jgi:predicted lipoprotein with Yx(FWY)xxD motif